MDLLTLGDITPVELQGQLGVSSSLLAHHLNQLESAGLLTRTRSEADRRRTYLHLNHGALNGLIPPPHLAVRRIVFVCTGNSARSQFAAAVWHDSSTVPVTSAGTHPAERIEPGAITAAGRHGLTLRPATPRGLDEVLDVDDFVVTVCDTAHEELGGAGQLHWSVPDPVRAGTDAAFDDAFDDISGRIHVLAPIVTTARGVRDVGDDL